MSTQPSSNVVAMPRKKTSRKPSARLRGQGTIFKRSEIFWMELHWHGTRHRRSLETADRETALIKLDAAVAAIRAGELPKKFDPITVQSMFDAFIARAEVDCKTGTVEHYKRCWDNHLESVFGSWVATQITKDKVVSYLHKRMKEGATLCTRNREQRVLMMAFGYNKSKIPADRYPEFPKLQSEKAHVRRGRLSNVDYEILRKRLDDARLLWMKAFLVMTFKFGFRKSELLKAKVSYFDPASSTFTLPAFTTKNNMERVVDIQPNGEIFKMLVALTERRAPEAALFTRDGRPVRDFRTEWMKHAAGLKGGSGKNGSITIHDLRRSAITNMSEKGVTAAQAGTHLTADVFARYISRNLNERRNTAKIIEDD